MSTYRFVMSSVLALVFSIATAAASDASRHCTIHPPKGADAAALQALVKISREEALQHAIDSLKTSAAVTAVDSELETEDGCLVWSFDLKVTGAKGYEEVQVDAGSGRVLSHEHESAKREQREKAAAAK